MTSFILDQIGITIESITPGGTTYQYCLGIGTLITLIVGVLLHSGVLHRIIVRCDKTIPQSFVIAYKIAYTKQVAKLHFKDTLSLLPTYKKIRIIYDKNLRTEGAAPFLVYATGFILNDDGAQLENDMELFMNELGYAIHIFPEITYALIAKHPYRNALSVSMARVRTYAKLSSYISKRSLCAHPKFEIYGDSDIVFMSPLHRQDDFYVDEAIMVPSYIRNGKHLLTNNPEKIRNGVHKAQ